MTLINLKSAPILLIEDDNDKNVLPLLFYLTEHSNNNILFCYELPVSTWRNIFSPTNVKCYEEINFEVFNKLTETKCCVIIDSVNQMEMCVGWAKTLNFIKQINRNPNVQQLILIWHKDVSYYSKMQLHLNHIANAVVSYDSKDCYKIKTYLKKKGKIIKNDEILTYDSSNNVLKSTLAVKKEETEEKSVKPLPSSLSTFKIEVEQTEKLEKFKLKLPYMSKINEGESKVYYEPDAVDDWDDEDPDEDLDI